MSAPVGHIVRRDELYHTSLCASVLLPLLRFGRGLVHRFYLTTDLERPILRMGLPHDG